MRVHKLVYNPFQENTYILEAKNHDCIIVDPGFLEDNERNHFVKFIKDNELKPVRLVHTHLHLDHVFGSDFIANEFGLTLEANEDDVFLLAQMQQYASQMGLNIPMTPPKIAKFYKDGDIINFDNTEIQLLHCPGHSPGSIVFYAPEDKFILSGDVLFAGSIGRTDLAGGDYGTLINSIRQKLLILDDDVVVYSGHGPETNIGKERKNNPFLAGISYL